jgi:hypothetical protein
MINGQPVGDKFASIAEEHLNIILAPGMLERAQYNTANKELRAWQTQLEAIYRSNIDPHYDALCPYCFQNMIRYFRRKKATKIQKEQALAKQADKIADEDRAEILELGIIDMAVAQSTNKPMHYLALVWIKSINPHFRADCDNCLSFVLKEFKAMKPFLEDLQNKTNLLNLIK